MAGSLLLFRRFHALRDRKQELWGPWISRSVLRSRKIRSGSTKRGWVVARVIEFYVPQNFKPKRQWVPADERGKVVEFPQPAAKKSA